MSKRKQVAAEKSGDSNAVAEKSEPEVKPETQQLGLPETEQQNASKPVEVVDPILAFLLQQKKFDN